METSAGSQAAVGMDKCQMMPNAIDAVTLSFAGSGGTYFKLI